LIVAFAITYIVGQHDISAACIEACLAWILWIHWRERRLSSTSVVLRSALSFAVDVEVDSKICLQWARVALLRADRCKRSIASEIDSSGTKIDRAIQAIEVQHVICLDAAVGSQCSDCSLVIRADKLVHSRL
jgi:hypothetical protein